MDFSLGKRRNMDRKVVALSLVIVVLLGIMAYLFLWKPYIQSEQQKGYVQCAVDVVNTVSQYGYIQIPLSNNRTLILIPYVPKNQTTNGS